MGIGRVGVWAFLDVLPAREAEAAAREIDDLGFGALWIPEALGRKAFTHFALLLAATTRLVVARGIANVWARDAVAMVAAPRAQWRALAKALLQAMREPS
ncbi:MAG TPA: LLM class flavin-dependent oxidoreductase [Candidatus Limnocylindria bacterium]|nr:LLM class flavin-dependent oxidoreductase [Candidatus Limnocylindria bacterium]